MDNGLIRWRTECLGGEEKTIVRKTLVAPRKATAEQRSAFLRECASMAALSHVGLPKLVDWRAEDSVSMSIELRPGLLLTGYVGDKHRDDEPCLSLQRVAGLAWRLSETLQYLHNQRPFPVIHRGLSPSSVWITQDGEPQLLDFGRLTSMHGPVWHSGELLEDRASPTDPLLAADTWDDTRIDVYGLGMILSFMIAGDLMRVGPSPTIPVPEDHRDFSRWSKLNRLLERCCAGILSDRPCDIAAFQESLLLAQGSMAALADGRETCRCGQSNPPDVRLCSLCGQSLFGDLPTGELKGLPFTYDERPEQELVDGYHSSTFASLGTFQIFRSLENCRTNPGLGRVISLDSLPNVAHMAHQKAVVVRALGELGGRALLADEVGLGKTIEAGLCLKELLQRNRGDRVLVDSVLVLCPGSIALQWQKELYHKFEEPFLVLGDSIDTTLAWQCKRLIAPYELLREHRHSDEVLQHRFDLVILDEVHNLTDEDNADVLETVRNIRKTFFLLLSATPMRTTLDELYHVITLLRPGTFDDLTSFREEFLSEDGKHIRNVERLHGLLSSAMIRTRRCDVQDYEFPTRSARTVQISMSDGGRRVYTSVQHLLHNATKDLTNRRVLSLVGSLGERLCSSSNAFLSHLGVLRRDRHVQRLVPSGVLGDLESWAIEDGANEVVQKKIAASVQLLRKSDQAGANMLIFTEYDETARFLHEEFRRQAPELIEKCFLYDMREGLRAREETVERCASLRGGFLVCPPGAREGQNLQFAGGMINFDLPWNPQNLEQRIGRIQRPGARTKTIQIVNLVLEGTVEEKIHACCEEKLRMFEAVVGEVEAILGNFEPEERFQDLVRDLFLNRETTDEDGTVATAQERFDKGIQRALRRADVPVEELLSRVATGDTSIEQQDLETFKFELDCEDDEEI